MLKWLRTNGCPWDKETCESTFNGRAAGEDVGGGTPSKRDGPKHQKQRGTVLVAAGGEQFRGPR